MTEKKTTMSLLEKLMHIQTELKAPKGQYNSFGKYNFRSAEDILEAVKPYLKTYRACLLLSDSIKTVGEETARIVSDKTTTDSVILRTYLVATAKLCDLDSDDVISVSAEAREPQTKTGMDSSQITGAASSYARKYALNGLFCIDDTKDADTMDNRDSGSPAKITDKQKQDLVALGANIPELCKYFQVENVDDLSYVQARQAINAKKKQGA